MSFDAIGSRIIFRNAAKVATFDSDEKNLIITNYVTQNLVFPARPRDTPETITDTVTDLGACHPLANVVLAWARWPDGTLRPANGTQIVYSKSEAMHPDYYGTYATGVYRLASLVAFSLRTANGRLLADVRYRFPYDSSFAFDGMTITVHALCGTFDF